MLKLLQKFLDSDVIQDVRGKLTKFDEEGSTLYCFVTEPGPLNFVEDVESPSRPKSLGKHTRPGGEEMESLSVVMKQCDDTLFTNEYAFLRCGNESMSESVAEETSGGGSRGGEDDSDDVVLGSPMKKCRSDSLVASKFNLQRMAVESRDSSSGNIESSVSHLVQLTPSQVAGVWKDLTLNRLLHLVELETLEGVLAYDAVDGKHIVGNVRTFMSRVLASRTTSTSGGMSLSSGVGCDHTVGGVSSGIGSTHPHWLSRRFGSKLSRVQPTPQPPPAANVHNSLSRCRSNSSMTSSTSSSLTLHHKLRFSIRHMSGSDQGTAAPPTTDRPSSFPRGGGRVGE